VIYRRLKYHRGIQKPFERVKYFIAEGLSNTKNDGRGVPFAKENSLIAHISLLLRPLIVVIGGRVVWFAIFICSSGLLGKLKKP